MPVTTTDNVCCTIRVTGLVQGVGFRPTVWRLANEERLTGYVINDGAGVSIQAAGQPDAIERFCKRMRDEAPPLARIEHIEIAPGTPSIPSTKSFIIGPSREGRVTTGIVPDTATCSACLEECFDPSNRRYSYPFTNCTHCGPRLSIIKTIPYDRDTTTMAGFVMCADCQKEYDEPSNRRFHAQPNACQKCGPRVWLEDQSGHLITNDPIEECAQLIASGKIIAIKGIGGFHLACNATRNAAVDELRRRKERDDKPLALMAANMEMVHTLAYVDDNAHRLLTSPAAPIVLLQPRDVMQLADAIAPGQSRVGIMLPYTPLHHVLLTKLARPLVMTSGNRSSEPQCTENQDARIRLAGIADYWLMSDREIANRLDDSVVRSDFHGTTIIRRARGFAPEPISLAASFHTSPATLAFGAELKSTFCFTRSGTATLSQHLGDLEDPTTCRDYGKAIELYRRLYAFTPEIIAVDKHPDYASTAWGNTLAQELQIPIVRVQHHHAHLASVLAENAFDLDYDRALGIILDGTGLGDDGTIWGGEFLYGGYRTFKRVGHLEAVGLPGGAAAIREPWRNTFAHLAAVSRSEAINIDLDRPILNWLNQKPIKTIEKMLAQSLNTPKTSSAGRLFDAVAGALGICRDRQSYEGQAAMELEALATPHMSKAKPYPFQICRDTPSIVRFAPMWSVLLNDLDRGKSQGQIAARFHRTLISAAVQTTKAISDIYPIDVVALSGGVFQNRILLDGIGTELEANSLRVLRHHRIPANDGGISLGQAAIASALALTQ